MVFKNVNETTKRYGIAQIITSSFAMLLLSVIVFAFPHNSDAAWQAPQDTSPSAYECTQVTLDDIDTALLTKEERVALLEESLSKSIDSYSTCVSSVTQAMASAQEASGGAVGQGNATDAGGMGDTRNNNESGNMALANQSQSEGAQSQQQIPVANMPPSAQSTASIRGIIAPKDNDKIICKLLFQEITKTQDPDMLKGLKEQYSNYKCG